MARSGKDEFEFLNSKIWLDYTQVAYRSLDEIKYRLTQQKALPKDWEELKNNISAHRKIGAVPLFLPSIEKKFWFYPSDSITRKINEIERIGMELYSRINQQPDFKQDFYLNSTIEEAITSAIYEGAHTTRAQAKQVIASNQAPQNKDEWMLINNYHAMEWVHGHRDQAVTEEVILELHKIVTQNTLEGDDSNFSGRFRNGKVFVGTVHEGIEHTLIRQAIEESLEITGKNPRYIHPLLKGILLHYFIAYIHPFFDGNGRTARALFYFKSMRNKLDYVQLLSISAYLKEHGQRYEKAFQKVVENDDDVTYFVDFCLDSIQSALLIVSNKVDYLLRVNRLKALLNLTANQIGLLQRLALHRFRTVSIEDYASQIKMSREVARQELKRLYDLKLLKETKAGKKLVYGIDKAQLEKLIEA